MKEVANCCSRWALLPLTVLQRAQSYPLMEAKQSKSGS